MTRADHLLACVLLLNLALLSLGLTAEHFMAANWFGFAVRLFQSALALWLGVKILREEIL